MKFTRYFFRLGACLLASAVLSPAAADKWVKVTTSHFELYTPAGEKRGREAILYFEQVRDFFLRTSASKRASDFPVRIITFKNEKQYAPFRPNEGNFAYYTSRDQRDYIVMQDAGSEHAPAAIHEYVHLLVHHTGAKLPLWLNEGMAEVYSTMRPLGGQILVGDLPRGRVAVLEQGKWFPLEALLRVQHDSPAYNEKDKMQIFYSESWLLAHMLILGDGYRPHFTKFLAALQTAKSTEEAMQQTYNKSVATIQKDLQSYLHGNNLKGALFDQKLEKSAETPEAVEVGAADADLVLADLLLVAGKHSAAEAEFKRLAAERPNHPDIEESLGYLAWQDKRMAEVTDHFRKAIAGGSRNAKLYNQFASLELQAGAPAEQLVPVLRKALELKPFYQDAAWNLTSAAMRAQQYSVALEALGQLKSVKPEDAFRYYYSTAYAYSKLGSKVHALRFVASARKAAKEPDDIANAERLERYLSEPPAPVEAEQVPTLRRQATTVTAESLHADPSSSDAVAPRLRRRDSLAAPGATSRKAVGSVTNLECNGRAARLHVKVDGRLMIFDIPDPTEVHLTGVSGTTFDFACGPQKPFGIAVEYIDYPPGQPGTGAGIVRGLALQ